MRSASNGRVRVSFMGIPNGWVSEGKDAEKLGFFVFLWNLGFDFISIEGEHTCKPLRARTT